LRCAPCGHEYRHSKRSNKSPASTCVGTEFPVGLNLDQREKQAKDGRSAEQAAAFTLLRRYPGKLANWHGSFSSCLPVGQNSPPTGGRFLDGRFLVFSRWPEFRPTGISLSCWAENAFFLVFSPLAQIWANGVAVCVDGCQSGKSQNSEKAQVA